MRGFHQSIHTAWPLVALLCGSLLTSEPLRAQAPEASIAIGNETIVPITAHRTPVELIEKIAKVLETKNRIVRVNGFDPLVLNVTALSENRISVTGLLQGVTSFVITDEERNTFTVEFFVKGDARTLQMLIDKKFPNSSIEVFKVQDAVALRGWVTNPEHITQIVDYADQFYPKVLNHMNVGGVQQVLLKVKVMEAQRSLIRQLGINFTYVGRNGYGSSNPGAIGSAVATLPSASSTATGRTIVTTAANSLLTNAAIGVVNDQNTFQSFLSMLREESLVKILAEPEVVAMSGRPATLLSGGEFPIIVPQSLGTVSIQYREFGVRMEATAIVLGNGNLRLLLQPEVSDRDDAHGVTINGTTVPGITVRRVNTQVEMKFGQTLMLAGLISNTQRVSMRKVPFLGELPYIGAAFSQKQMTEAETEIVITVTPELVAPLDDGQVPPGGPGQSTDTPTDREFMIYGLSEVPKYGERCPTCAPGTPGSYSVPGLKDMVAPQPSAAPAAATPERRELLAPPAPSSDESARSRARRITADFASRQKVPKNNSGLRQVGYDEAAVKARAGESTRPAAPALVAPPAAPRTAAPPRPANDTQNNGNGKPPANTNLNSNRNRKPGLIEPAAR